VKRNFFSILVSLILIFTFSATAFAADKVDIAAQNEVVNIEIQDGELSLTTQDIAAGTRLFIVLDDKGIGHIVKESSNTIMSAQVIFDVDLSWDSDKTYSSLRWTAIMPSDYGLLKNVTGSLYVKSTSILYPETYYDDIIHCPYLDGSASTASNQESTTIEIPPDESSVRVGWMNLMLIGVTKTLSVANGSGVVYPS